MHPKLYITDIPYYLTETKLRSVLGDYHLHSLTFIHTVHGDVGVVELDTLEDAQKLTVTFSRFTLEDGCKLSAIPAESRAGQTIEERLSHITQTRDGHAGSTMKRSA